MLAEKSVDNEVVSLGEKRKPALPGRLFTAIILHNHSPLLYLSNFLLYFSPLYLLQLLMYAFPKIPSYQTEVLPSPKDFQPFMLPYTIDDTFNTPVTTVFFTRSKRTYIPICLKEWPRRIDLLVPNESERFENLQEGLAFNRRFAPRVYLGIARMNYGAKQVRRGWLITDLQKRHLQEEVPYAIVMKRLPAEQRLDNYLNRQQLANDTGMEYLAHEIACMHHMLERSGHEMGKPEHLIEKLEMNISLFHETLDYLKQHVQISDGQLKKSYEVVSLLRQYAREIGLDANNGYFVQRYKSGNVKRCHGDLKTVNLWIRPRSLLTLFHQDVQSRHLLALDCIDFNPLLCHIDTLSDVAMFAVDVEARLKQNFSQKEYKKQGIALIRKFVAVYLHQMNENKDDEMIVWLLEYYMTEKAMVCAHAFFMYYNEPEIAREYLAVALRHSQLLKDLSQTIVKKRKPGRTHNLVQI